MNCDNCNKYTCGCEFLNQGPVGGHHLGGDACPPTTFENPPPNKGKRALGDLVGNQWRQAHALPVPNFLRGARFHDSHGQRTISTIAYDQAHGSLLKSCIHAVAVADIGPIAENITHQTHALDQTFTVGIPLHDQDQANIFIEPSRFTLPQDTQSQSLTPNCWPS